MVQLCYTVVVETSPATIERELVLAILRGDFAAGAHLPSVRDLAARHGVSPGTIQRVVARLETRGLVEARQGSGLRVRDARESGDLSLLPLWLEATWDRPAEAAALLAEFLEFRRLIAVHLLVKHRAAILARAASLRALAEALLRARGVDARRTADLAFVRELLRATGSISGRAVFNTLAEVLVRSPEVCAAMYAEPAQNTRAMGNVLEALLAARPGMAVAIEHAFREVDARTAARFEAGLRRRLGASS